MILHVGARAPEFAAPATLFDGQSAAPQAAMARVDEEARCLSVEIGGAVRLTWPLADIREVPDQARRDILVIRHRDDPLARVILQDRALLPRLPEADRAAPVTGRRRLALWAMAAIASVALIVGVLVPRMADQLANYIPPEGERALGEVTLNQIREALGDSGVAPVPFCTNEAGLAGLRRVEARLADQLDLQHDLTVSVLDHDMVNAFALPGGYVVLFRGLIDAAEAPDEVAAVLAHEVGHVVSRDPTRHALRSAGSIGVLGLLFGDFAGGAMVLVLAERLIEAQYSQEAETGADAFAHDLLLSAGLAPEALGRMFERLRARGGEPEGLLAHLMSHPALADRIAEARAATPAGFTATPVLDAAEWAAFRNICD
ncbi:M48 family metallopeptidase [Aestuariicoccus sp. MJ-SS9]|uniref:M48 family metallopeptidase n=1 Tax=Aestuariicoccus sp. MJ-SS9 TaxID=3079855 RepID=UPI0029099700|nr:M48 family metallopeptidase [Aestuariicoccus sp. MJ-SS9]MDU8909643.1 M48 family metallopeptidase [Aestuariicoccus sp. MJ-SS9]